MKKVIPFILILLFILAFAISYASAERGVAIVLELPDKDSIPKSKLPAYVTVIEDEAFEGTALVKVELPETVRSLGERSFANISTLQEVRIPLATKYIASTAFDGSYRTTITAPANSYAKAYARTHGLPFSPIVMFCASVQGQLVQVVTLNRAAEIIDRHAKSDFKPETQWRRIEEINVARTEELIANHVQGRSPPMG